MKRHRSSNPERKGWDPYGTREYDAVTRGTVQDSEDKEQNKCVYQKRLHEQWEVARHTLHNNRTVGHHLGKCSKHKTSFTVFKHICVCIFKHINTESRVISAVPVKLASSYKTKELECDKNGQF